MRDSEAVKKGQGARTADNPDSVSGFRRVVFMRELKLADARITGGNYIAPEADFEGERGVMWEIWREGNYQK